MDEDLESEDTNPELAALSGNYPELAGKDPSDVLRGLIDRQFSNIQQQRTARERVSTAKRAAFEAGLEEIKQRRYGAPTTSQQLAALSQALLSPRRQRGIAGTFANLAPVFGQMATLQAGAEEKRAEAEQRLRQQYASDTDAAMLAGLEAEGAALEPLIRTYGTLAKPRVPRAVGVQPIGGKTVVVMQDPDTGVPYQVPLGDAPKNLVPLPNVTSGGQPVFRSPDGIVNAAGQPVARFDPPKEKAEKPRAPSATEMREMFKTEDDVNSASDALYTLQKALNLNEQALEGSLSGWRKTLGQMFSSDDPQYVATEEFDNLQLTAAMQKLKTTFGGAISDGERKAITALEAVSKYPRPVRARIIQNGMDAIQRILTRETKRLEGLKTGQYGQYQQPAAAPAKVTPRVINWGN